MVTLRSYVGIVIKLALLSCITVGIVKDLNSIVYPIPVKIVESEKVDEKRIKMEKTLIRLGCPSSTTRQMAIAILEGSGKINVDPHLIAALIRTESDFDKSAVSSKGYKGLMQTPVATKEWEDVDVLIGCKILEEKLKYAKGDLQLALALYKGGNNPEAHRLAKKVIELYKEIKDDDSE